MVGRFTKQKNHLLAIRCFKKIAEKKRYKFTYNWQWRA